MGIPEWLNVPYRHPRTFLRSQHYLVNQQSCVARCQSSSILFLSHQFFLSSPSCQAWKRGYELRRLSALVLVHFKHYFTIKKQLTAAPLKEMKTSLLRIQWLIPLRTHHILSRAETLNSSAAGQVGERTLSCFWERTCLLTHGEKQFLLFAKS